MWDEVEPAKGYLYPALGLRGSWGPLCARAVLPRLISAGEEMGALGPTATVRVPVGAAAGEACLGPQHRSV